MLINRITQLCVWRERIYSLIFSQLVGNGAERVIIGRWIVEIVYQFAFVICEFMIILLSQIFFFWFLIWIYCLKQYIFARASDKNELVLMNKCVGRTCAKTARHLIYLWETTKRRAQGERNPVWYWHTEIWSEHLNEQWLTTTTNNKKKPMIFRTNVIYWAITRIILSTGFTYEWSMLISSVDMVIDFCVFVCCCCRGPWSETTWLWCNITYGYPIVMTTINVIAGSRCVCVSFWLETNRI